MIIETRIYICHKCHSKEIVKSNPQNHCGIYDAYGVLEQSGTTATPMDPCQKSLIPDI